MIKAAYIFVLFLFAWVQFYNSAVYSIYEFNKSQFIEDYCENKDKPELKCDGKCHLSEQMIDLTENSEEPTINYLPEILLFLSADPIHKELVNYNEKQSFHEYNWYSDEFYSRIEHPPKLS